MPCFVSVVCNKLTTLLAPTKKLLVSWQFSGPYGVTKDGSGWRKDVVNQCLEFALRAHTPKTQEFALRAHTPKTNLWFISALKSSWLPLVEFMYVAITRMPGESYRRRLRSLLSCLCDVFLALINSFVWWFISAVCVFFIAFDILPTWSHETGPQVFLISTLAYDFHQHLYAGLLGMSRLNSSLHPSIRKHFALRPLPSFGCCLTSSDVGWLTRDKLRPMREHGSVLLYVQINHKAV